LFVHPTDEERHAALADLSDADLIGRYWPLEDLTALTTEERHRLETYRYETFGYEKYCEELVAHRPRGVSDVANLTAVLDRWDCAFYNLRLWHWNRANNDVERNPIAKVLIYEESRITGVRARLQVGVATPTPQPLAAIISDPSSRARADLNSPVSTTRPPPRKPHADPDGVGAVIALAESVDNLAEAINRLTDSIARQ
jgi:hypothetical protein